MYIQIWICAEWKYVLCKVKIWCVQSENWICSESWNRICVGWILDPNFYWTQNFFRPNIFLDTKNVWAPKTWWPTKLFITIIFQTKKKLNLNFFWNQFFLEPIFVLFCSCHAHVVYMLFHYVYMLCTCCLLYTVYFTVNYTTKLYYTILYHMALLGIQFS